MKRPSQNTWELIRGLHASQSFWEKLVGRQDPPLSSFDEIAAADEALVIPHLTTFLLSGRSQVRDTAARTIGRLLANVQSSDYVQLDEACRNDWSYESSASSVWRRLKPTDVKQFWRLPDAIAVVGVTGCVFGGKLTALRYPEKELVSIPAKQTYAESHKPFLPAETQAPALSAQQQHDDLLDLADVTGKRIVSTRLHGSVTIREENATAALEVMSRFAANPKWLIYLPPTMSPSETSHAPGLLEHPAEAFAYFRHAGVPRVICEEKHMGSRAIVAVCRDEDAACKRFGVTGEGIGICYTRTGRRFFDNTELETRFLERVRVAATDAGFWDEFKTDWICFDCELMPWSAKAQELLKQQYAAVGAAARATLADEVGALEQAAKRGLDVNELLAHTTARRQSVNEYVAAYRRYCWSVDSVSDLKLAPFHLLATEGSVHADKPHDWHMHTLARLAGGIIVATPFHVIDVTSPDSEAKGIGWWEELTAIGGEGMVVKPLEFVAKNRRGLIQPAVKCRGREYLRIIYGPEYTATENLERLRARGLSTKRSLALREFALGIEALERFVRKEPLRRVHEAVFGVLALESEPVDPRL